MSPCEVQTCWKHSRASFVGSSLEEAQRRNLDTWKFNFQGDIVEYWTPVLEIRVAGVACWEDQRHLGGTKTFGRTKKLGTKKFNSKRSWGNQTTCSHLYLLNRTDEQTKLKFTRFLEDQMDQKSALGGPKPISRTGGSLLKNWSYTSNQCIYFSILLYWRPHLAKTLFILFIFYCIYGDSWKKYKSRAWRTWFWVSSRWDNIKRNVEPCKRSTLAFSMSYLFGKLSWTILLANCTHISTTTETVPYIDF